ncbi:MAG: hypothetical protein QM528_06115 [Phycisphaerales bacterium]|nr:hypothetical protein [Phycisphaerales bacterium]
MKNKSINLGSVLTRSKISQIFGGNKKNVSRSFCDNECNHDQVCQDCALGFICLQCSPDTKKGKHL